MDTKKRIKILTSGIIKIKGFINGPVLTPYYEDLNTIFALVSGGVKVVEVCDDGFEVALDTFNFSDDNSKAARNNRAAELAAKEEAAAALKAEQEKKAAAEQKEKEEAAAAKAKAAAAEAERRAKVTEVDGAKTDEDEHQYTPAPAAKNTKKSSKGNSPKNTQNAHKDEALNTNDAETVVVGG